MRSFCGKVRDLLVNFFRPIPKQIPVMIPVLQSELLKDRTALITGGTRGVGYAIAEAFARAGARVTITGRDKDRLGVAVDKLKRNGSRVDGVVLDITNVSSIVAAMEAMPQFDILVNNAGYVGGGNFGDTCEEGYDLVLDTNLKGHYFLSQAVAKKWMTQGVKGNILNVCSASSLRPGTSPYILSKWGLRALTVGMAKKLIKYGIVVNGIAPGVTNTDQFTGGEKGISKSSNPSGRMVTKEEVANMSTILVSPLCRMVVGDILFMTGGAGVVTLDD